ncbi:MAG: 1-acyl-sn-glycerol-3-phosphate acyltransferase [Burkholderiales bacterium]|nr:MAG: 1-acyl-sn-glycerol-3-phosphate acyltransferase [Burkholderiales bacterium]
MFQATKNILFVIAQLTVTPIYLVIGALTFWLPARQRNLYYSGYTGFFIWLAKVLCGIRYEIRGWENVPKEPCVVLSKHSSTWETLALETWFAPGSFVAKKELLWVPFFGWGFALSSPITIDRKAGAQAMEKMIEQGKERLLKRRFNIIVFPEGTRIKAGQRGKYKTGGVRLAIGCEAVVLPVAHNAGYCWPRHPWKKYPGIVTLSILPPLDTRGRVMAELNTEIEQIIEDEVARLGDGRDKRRV